MLCLLCEKRPSVFVEVDLYGLPGDSHKKIFKTKTVVTDGLNTIFDDLRNAPNTFKFNLEKVRFKK